MVFLWLGGLICAHWHRSRNHRVRKCQLATFATRTPHAAAAVAACRRIQIGVMQTMMRSNTHMSFIEVVEVALFL